ncbi:MAG: hypothetical protein GF383_15525 [Candidatus Lokiarchaeota archaeon]|nr:hypothetical protein [Candidatus Lokiarchaeota archaeon]MBD3342971.1 hypothetical protein [Candidatus Lokiarchaeota archaeon]
MIEVIRSFLRDLGLNDIQLNFYNHFLRHRFCTIKDLRQDYNYSYSQTYNNLDVLEELGLIDSTDDKPKLYFRVNPKEILSKKLEEKYKEYSERINILDKEIRREESLVGVCQRNITFYHYSELAPGIDHLISLIDNSNSRIVMSALPPSLLKKIEYSLRNAFLKGVEISFFFSRSDFETIQNIFEVYTNILKKLRIKITQTEERTCRLIRFNDLIVNNGILMIDDFGFNTIIFQEDEILHFDGFTAPNLVAQSKKELMSKTKVKTIEINYPKPYQEIIDIISEKKKIKTRELSKLAGIGGSKLRNLLNFLIKDGKIQEKIENEGVGRPASYFMLI